MKKDVWALALGVALFPPLWAVFSPYIGVQTGAVALICAAVYVANGNKVADGIKISIGFLLGDIWAVLALMLMSLLTFNHNLSLFLILFVLGGLVVLLSSLLPKFIYCPSWLCGFAIGLCVMAHMGFHSIGTYPIQIGISMLAGVWYTGWGIDRFHRILLRKSKF